MQNRIRPVQHSTTTTTTPALGALLVDFDSLDGQDRNRFDRTKLDTTVTATVTVRSIDRLAGGHARGIIDGDGGYAIFYIDRDHTDRLAGILTPDATVTVRGTHQLIGTLPTINIFAARAVNV
ncbi:MULTISPECIES: hypothetical protein [Streptomyces rochei group]|uniref:hypothetical protein n=1 Tax=Streptomyces rochei group TaxID=2867164 RepID=UPI0018763B82|nr:hypothetical protein [Streptomyces vinaceusdrappus]GHC37610.1 hypothetical protein GCM10010308_65310 [Streptomyces vinaceusdrappus]